MWLGPCTGSATGGVPPAPCIAAEPCSGEGCCGAADVPTAEWKPPKGLRPGVGSPNGEPGVPPARRPPSAMLPGCLAACEGVGFIRSAETSKSWNSELPGVALLALASPVPAVGVLPLSSAAWLPLPPPLSRAAANMLAYDRSSSASNSRSGSAGSSSSGGASRPSCTHRCATIQVARSQQVLPPWRLPAPAAVASPPGPPPARPLRFPGRQRRNRRQHRSHPRPGGASKGVQGLGRQLSQQTERASGQQTTFKCTPFKRLTESLPSLAPVNPSSTVIGLRPANGAKSKPDCRA
jgi:hypothetical protein